MDRTTFPGFSQMTTSEVKVFAKSLIDEGYTTEEALDFMEGIDRCLNILASASIINRFAGKAKWNRKSARQLLFDTAMQIPIPTRFQNIKE
ncbi:hypothetical protein [Dysgonomonas sp. GY617]|uniref:hypothetical protein n=1 Tax=Dysgonomonas sp. GY617 TaxID=2780420 RepID=UPI0018836DFA|nr:hypothetical protein [Dysgonomonas sp. GY617]MBF0578186.1 hypothetical protein [Dysgonomonas sp. GY617]